MIAKALAETLAAVAPFHLLRPYGLLMLVPAVALWFVQRHAHDATRQWRSAIDPELLAYLLTNGGPRLRATPNTLILIVWALGVFAFCGPTWRYEPSPFADAKPPVVLVLKVAPSMLAADLAPTRLDRATQKMSDLLKLRRGAAAGLVVYSGSAHLVLPPTADTDVVMTMAKAMRPDIMPRDGDDLIDALTLAKGLLAEGDRAGSILLLTDGVAPSASARIAQERNSAWPAIEILALAPRERIDVADQLRSVARALDANLIATTVDDSDVEEIASALDRVGETRDVGGEGQRWQDAGYWLTPVLALLTLAWFRRGWTLS